MKHAALVLLVVSYASTLQAEDSVPFARDVLPILSANCFACHGPDEGERQADLRLDIEQDAKAERGDGAAIVPGEPDQSGILLRMTSDDPDLRMPPAESHKTVTPEQIEIIRRWIAEGARWQQHWSFQPVERPGGTLDELVRARLSERGLALQAAADPHTLVRRLYLDLIGLPPTPEEADAFAQDASPAAYERLVDELLQRPQFGEHWARMWLDLARYADTKGYEKDLGRSMWPYRDWVVNALNADMPLDQFTLEQLAGDLLPDATPQQKIATAFHRNTMSNDEGGTDDEEFRVAAVKDRVDTTIQVWMGLTMGCAKCHSHKYDPISNEDYYRLYAILNQTEDADRYDDAPRMEVLNEDEQAKREALQQDVARVAEELKVAEQADAQMQAEMEDNWVPARVVEATSRGGATLTVAADQTITAAGPSEAEDQYTLTITLDKGTYTALRLEALPIKLPDGQLGVGRNPADPNFVVSEFQVERLEGDTTHPLELAQARADFSQEGWPVAAAIDGDGQTGWAVSPRARERHVAIFDLAEPLQVDDPRQLRITILQQYGNRLTLANFRIGLSSADPARLTPPQPSPATRQLREQLAAAQKALDEFNADVAMVPVMKELPADKRRETRIHNRGNFLDPGDAVEPAVLGSLHPLPDDASPDRLGLARWLVSRDNPLTPRVWANRVWARLFGRGWVETEEDFGALGASPTNAAALEWLAAEYRDGGWSLKRLVKSIVMSDTYKQASHVAPALREADPNNELASRGARYRLGAEVVRDQALAVSGLLSPKMGGPSVMPPQPAGLWRSTYNGKKWIDAEGEDRYRRGLYTYLKRTTPYPSFNTFDAGSGEVCLIRRIRTNTPLQALVTLNDPVYLEAAAALARRMVSEAATPQARVERGLRLALIRPLREGEAQPLVALQRDAQRDFEAAPERAEALIASGRTSAGEMPPAEFAAWVITASAVLNLDEFLSRN